ncbi:hypothetical protein B0I27_107194 [Arcticibacter pallidicorallinus]|uniref:Uncharacterized protein n=1 Tax=Arcticibacter pallidicorallinus TaxID=1259464 RepID=A0A2T0U0Y2_9SPHI|nr:hypothetical protein [Arcticibacter pallidicorallinus]PRY51606.1 hypothetical protein B0I27_107194 [Arcticibacter pallidicorallinus]
MKKKEKELTKKARKQIRLSLEELLTEEIKKAIIGQGRNPKKAAKEIKKSVSLIAKTLAQKESLSQPEEKKDAPEIPLIRKSVKSFDVPPIPAPELPVIQDPPLAKPGRIRKPTGAATIKAEAKPASPSRRGRKASSQTTAEAEAVPVRPVRKRTPRPPVVKVEESTADTETVVAEEGADLSPGDQENTNP